MNYLLGAEGGSNVGTIIGLVVLLVLLVLYVGFGVVNRKKSQEQTMKMLNELKAGDKIVTYSGIYGEIVSMRETNMGRVLTIVTGDKSTGKVSYMEINSSVIMGVDTKEDLILDENGNVIEPEKDCIAIGSGGNYAYSAALAYLDSSDLSAKEIAERSLHIAGSICIYTNDNIIVEEL